MLSLRYLLSKCIRLVLTVVLIVSFVFVLVRVIPGDPATVIAGPNAASEELALIRARIGTDRPLPVQYGEWLVAASRLDFGTSYFSGEPALELIAARLPLTLRLAGAAFVVSLLIGAVLGVPAGVKQGHALDLALAAPAHLLLAVPEFWLGILLLLAFAVHLNAFPLFGYEGWVSLVLPVTALALGRGAVLARYIRSSLGAELQREYVTAARVRGLSPVRVVLFHAAPNALLPVITIAAIQLGYLIGGVVIVENVFSLPGIGRLLLSSIFRRDYPVVQATVMLSAAAFSVASFFADLLYGIADPRLRG